MKFNKIYAAQYLECGGLHLSKNPHGAIAMSSNALRHYTEAVTGRSIPLHYLDDDGDDDDDDLPPPPPPAEPCPYKKDKDGIHRPVAEDLPALKRKSLARRPRQKRRLTASRNSAVGTGTSVLTCPARRKPEPRKALLR